MPKVGTIILDKLRVEIRRYDKPEFRRDYQQFYAEELDEPVKIRTNILRAISNQTYREIRKMTAAEILDICESLLSSGGRYMRFFAFDWAQKLAGRYAKSDFVRFERWLKVHVDNWSSCDHLCCGALGEVLAQYHDLVPRTRKWSKSTNRWLRRASAVCLILPLRKTMDIDIALKRADLLLADTDDLVQKGCGWMLKEGTKRFPKEVLAYVLTNRKKMSRTTLRYAIEKLPPAQRRAAMEK
jgi:3-methyladenine DNA glycosylase AlkD